MQISSGGTDGGVGNVSGVACEESEPGRRVAMGHVGRVRDLVCLLVDS